MSSILPRILLVAFIMMSLEGFANLEGLESSHQENDVVHLHSDEAPDANLDKDSHCSHCFHQHGAGILPSFDVSYADQESEAVFDRTLMVLSTVVAPPTPPPNR